MKEFSIKLHSYLIRSPFTVIFSLFIIVQFAIYIKIGIVTDLEAAKYVREGNLLFEEGRFTDTKYIFYLPVILLVYLCRLFEVPLDLIVIFQVLLSGSSIYFFYKLGAGIGNKEIGFYSSILLILFLPLQIWNFYLYTDSIFISLTIIFTYIVYYYRDKGITGLFIILFFLGLIIVSRPNGMLFIPPLVLYLFFSFQTNWKYTIFKYLICLSLLLSFYYLLNKAFTGGGDLDILLPFIEEHIICFIPTKSDSINLKIVRSNNPLHDLFYYILNNPLHFFKLTIQKFFSFFNFTRPYYSAFHNGSLLAFLMPVYIFSLIGINELLKKKKTASYFMLWLMLLYPIAISLQCNDWHNRFTLVVLPSLILISCFGMYSIVKKINNLPTLKS